MIIITNLCIGITFLFSIILIIDELYNLGFFTFNYTYQYNYGSFISKFNNIQTIEYETNRFNVYNNINFLFKDIFNKSYFNNLLIIVATLLTVLCCIAYGVYFYYKFIIEQPDICSYDGDVELSFPKQLLKCLCDECHKIIPNCTGNYLIVFIIIIIIPLSYILKVLFNFNITPNTNSALFGFLYICLFILLLFYYSFNLFNRKTDYKYKDLIIYSLFTIIFISSGYIFKYIYSKYTDINLNSSNNITTIYDIYKQTPPIKPPPIQKPIYKGKDLLSVFKYNDKDKDPEYKIKKTIMDDYFKATKDFDIDMKHYNERYNAYTSSLISTKLGDKTNFFDISINILGLNNYMHLYLLFLIIISYIIYNIYSDEVSYICFIYLLTLFITLTIMNGILYYNTCINKYIIYEPLAHYKNDITNANTALNLELNSSSGVGFYNKLINSNKILNDLNSDANIKTDKQILEDIKKIVDVKYYTNTNLSSIYKDIQDYEKNKIDMTLGTDDISNIPDVTFLYKKKDGDFNIDTEKPITYLFSTCLNYINPISKNLLKIEPIKLFTFKYSNYDVRITIPMSGYYKYCYYKAYQYQQLLNSNYLSPAYKNDKITLISNLNDIIYTIISSLQSYKDTTNDNYIKNNITINFASATNIIDNANANIFMDNITSRINGLNSNIFNNIDLSIIEKSNNITNSKITTLSIDTNTYAITDANTYIKKTVTDDFTYGDISYKIDYNNFKENNLLISTNYYQLPNKIIDNKNDEYYLIIKKDTIKLFTNYGLINNTENDPNNFIKYHFKSKYTNGVNINANIFDNTSKITTLTILNTDNYSIPFNLYRKNKDTSSYSNKLKNVILAVLYNSICNIQSSFINNDLLQKLKRQKNTSGSPDPININKPYIFKYYDKFNSSNIDDLTIKNRTLLSITVPVKNATIDIISYIVLLYNVYRSSTLDIKKIISNNIKYLITTYDSSFTSSENTVSNHLNKIIDKTLLLDMSDNMKMNIDKTDELFIIYSKNIYIINIIISLFENLFSTIKTEISKTSPELCLPTSTSLLTIENVINSKYNSKISNTDPAKNNFNTVYTNVLIGENTLEGKAIINIDKHLMWFFNIVLFLLNNLKSDNNEKNNTITAIKSGFNFYNKDDIVKDIIIRQLKINCDYFSKYNNLDTKQLSYFKMNSDNVNYNFPILMIIFLIVLGEPIFIKS
jgi:hypothetical protein